MARVGTRYRQIMVSGLLAMVAGILAVMAGGDAQRVVWLGAVVAVGILAAIADVGTGIVIGIAAYSILQKMLMGLRMSMGLLVVNGGQLYLAGLSLWTILVLWARREEGRLVGVRAMHLVQGAWVGYVLLRVSSRGGVGAGLAVVGKIAAVALWLWLAESLGRRWPNHVRVGLGLTAGIVAITPVLALVGLLPGRPGLEGGFDGGLARYTGTFGQTAVATATSAMVGLPVFAVWWSVGRTRLARVAAGVGWTAMGIVIALTLTRTAVVTLLVFGGGVLLWGVGRRGMSASQRVAVAVGLMILLAVAVVIVPEQYVMERAKDLPGLATEGGLRPNYGSGRVMLWQTTLGLLAHSSWEQLVMGHGLLALHRALEQHVGIYVGAHNSYLQIAYDLGVVGLVLYLLSVMLVLRELARVARVGTGDGSVEARYWMIYFVAFLLSTVMFNHYVYEAGPQWLTYVGVGLALSRRQAGSSAPILQ